MQHPVRRIMVLGIILFAIVAGLCAVLPLQPPKGSIRGTVTKVEHSGSNVTISVRGKHGSHYLIQTDNPTPMMAGPIYTCLTTPTLSKGDKVEFALPEEQAPEGITTYSTCHTVNTKGHFYIKKLSGPASWLQ